MSEIKFLQVDNLIYKCEVETKVDGVEFKKENEDNNLCNSLYIYLKCSMTQLSMSQHDLLNMLFNDFIDIDTCYKYTPESNIITSDDMRDITIDLNFKHILYFLHILPNGNDNCIVVLKNCFYDSNAFNVVESKKVTKPIKLDYKKYLENLKKELYINKDKIIDCFETIDSLRDRNKEINIEIVDLEKYLSND
jgi:hypothetical protein